MSNDYRSKKVTPSKKIVIREYERSWKFWNLNYSAAPDVKLRTYCFREAAGRAGSGPDSSGRLLGDAW